ncbi:MAG: MoxR family ATPase [Planctomycetaceae bacterium]|nr:MoxR family ATPase [Planctomycetaceae bacterium]
MKRLLKGEAYQLRYNTLCVVVISCLFRFIEILVETGDFVVGVIFFEMGYIDLVRILESNISLAVFGKRDVIRRCLIALFSSEHVLLEDVPGVGKTLIAQAIARSISGDFRRIQFTPDLLPADIVGSSIFDTSSQEFRFARGAVFANILLADEINRTTPRTQSAMLEAMNEHQVSVDGITHMLPTPFMVIATENPMEYEGTYPLPESQLDRFLLRISVGYPGRESELDVLRSHQTTRPINNLRAVLSCEQIIEIQQAVSNIRVDEAINRYILEIVEVTRLSDELMVGVSTRGAIALSRAAQTLALISGRSFVVPDDVKELAIPVLAHRIIPTSYSHGSQRQNSEALIERIVETVDVPV